MGSSGQLYSLSWGEFGTSLASAVQLLRGHGDLVDVTLAAGGRSFPAHKIVLSAASPFLLDLLKSTPCKHPVVMLAGVSSDDLESLLEFVYRGEVSVESSKLPSLLQAANCLNIHGLTPPTILAENGQEVPASAIPTTEPITREIMNSSIPIHRRKKRRKSSSSSGKWAKTDSNPENEDRHNGHEDDRTTDFELKNDDGIATDDVGEQSENSNHRIHDWPSTKKTTSDLHGLHQDQLPDTKASFHNLMAMQQQYSPLHIPSFTGSLTNLAMPPFGLATTASTSASNAANLKIRGASDCPGICPLCGATLRQARNLRRHLLSSCKYRLNSYPAMQQPADHLMVEIKPEIDLGGFSAPNHGNDSRESNSCEQIVCNPSPLPSPTNLSNAVSPRNSAPTIAR